VGRVGTSSWLGRQMGNAKRGDMLWQSQLL
jgi:hypothetical protein